jgi:hypothetical protein
LLTKRHLFLPHYFTFLSIHHTYIPADLNHLNQLTDFYETWYEHNVRSRSNFAPFNSLISVPTRLMCAFMYWGRTLSPLLVT